MHPARPSPSVAPAWRGRFFTFSALHFARFEAAVWILFLRSRGLSLAAVGLAEVAYHVSGLLDRLGPAAYLLLAPPWVALAVGSRSVSA